MHSIKDKDIIYGNTDILKICKFNNSFVYDGALLHNVKTMIADKTNVHFRSVFFFPSTSSF